MTKKILFIANPVSKIIKKKNTESYISGFSDKYYFKWEIYYTEISGNQLKIRKKIQEYQPDIVVAAGGDGTINQVASQLIGSNIELGIIPGGSANGLAYNLGIPFGFEEALQLILNSDSKPIDVIELNERNYCLHLSDIGINARIVNRFEKEGSKGLLGYGKQMIKELLSKRIVFSFNLITPGLNKRFRAEMLVIANARSFGTGAIINPVGRLDDGLFEIIIIRPYPWWVLLHLLKMFFFGKIDNLKYIKVIKTSWAEIKFERPQDLQADGEIVKGVEALNIKIIPSAVKVHY